LACDAGRETLRRFILELRNVACPHSYALCISSGIMHFKAMIFTGQNTVEFGGANYSAWAFLPVTP
jgi:hypothetical protein